MKRLLDKTPNKMRSLFVLALILPVTLSGCTWEDVAELAGFEVINVAATDFGQSAKDARKGAGLMVEEFDPSNDFTYSRRSDATAEHLFRGRLRSVTVSDDRLIVELRQGGEVVSPYVERLDDMRASFHKALSGMGTATAGGTFFLEWRRLLRIGERQGKLAENARDLHRSSTELYAEARRALTTGDESRYEVVRARSARKALAWAKGEDLTVRFQQKYRRLIRMVRRDEDTRKLVEEAGADYPDVYAFFPLEEL